MKKIINGRMYNTETAKACGEWSNGYYTNDFSYCAETLYRKKTGEFFLFGEGGAMSKYSERCGDMRGYGEQIIPLTEEAARAWAEKRLTAEEYIGVFGEPEE